VAGVPVLHDQGRSPRRLCGGNYIVPPPCLNLVTRDSTRCDCSTSRYIISLLCMTEIHKYLPNPWWFGIVWIHSFFKFSKLTSLFGIAVPSLFRFPAPTTAECGRSDSEVGYLDEVLSFYFGIIIVVFWNTCRFVSPVQLSSAPERRLPSSSPP
jgi:hypothetical protein